MMSSGIALMAADSMVMANPDWIQIMTAIMERLLFGGLSRNCWGSRPSQTRIWLSRPICSMPAWSGRNS